jgi:hypothetical protein
LNDNVGLHDQEVKFGKQELRKVSLEVDGAKALEIDESKNSGVSFVSEPPVSSLFTFFVSTRASGSNPARIHRTPEGGGGHGGAHNVFIELVAMFLRSGHRIGGGDLHELEGSLLEDGSP